MWASNFPVAALRVSYENELLGMLEILNHLPKPDIDRIFKFNTAHFYKIDLSKKQQPVKKDTLKKLAVHSYHKPEKN